MVPGHEGEHGQPAECSQKTAGGGKQTQPRSEEEGIHGGDHEAGNDGHSVLIFFWRMEKFVYICGVNARAGAKCDLPL